MGNVSDGTLGAEGCRKCTSALRPLRAESRRGRPRLSLPKSGFLASLISLSHLSLRPLSFCLSFTLPSSFPSWLFVRLTLIPENWFPSDCQHHNFLKR